MEKLQDDFHEHMARKYPDLSRGISKKITRRRHVSPQMYKQTATLYEHYDQILNAINNIGMVGNAKAKENAIELLGRYAPELANVKSNLESTQKYINVLESRLSNEEWKVMGCERQIDAMDAELFKERMKVDELERQLTKLSRLLDRLPDELKEELLRKPKEKERDAR